MTAYSWARFHPHGYECSSHGDPRFSALYARLADGRTIEEAYQLDVKGYRSLGSNWRLGKGKPPLVAQSHAVLWAAYRALWGTYLAENPQLIEALREHTVLTDKFARTPVSQARALAELMNELTNA